MDAEFHARAHTSKYKHTHIRNGFSMTSTTVILVARFSKICDEHNSSIVVLQASSKEVIRNRGKDCHEGESATKMAPPAVSPTTYSLGMT